jgi:ATP-binding cassette subfamily G (WHITE) protein 2 (SNQ2)
VGTLSETTASFEGRAILAKHKGFTLYRPAALFFAQTLADIPTFFVSQSIFCIVIFFLVNLRQTAGNCRSLALHRSLPF